MIYTDLGHCLKRESDGAYIPKDLTNTDYDRALQEVAVGVSTIQQAPAVDPTPARIAAAWEAAHDLAIAAIDSDARDRFGIWFSDPDTSPAKRQAIKDCVAWMDSIWQTYGAVKAQILAGNDAKFQFSTPCPYTFWEVVAL
jgi:hypothetical protein